ncbi:Primosomal protein DnaI [Sporosarcina pasteurii]|uniref:Primosomal protein DnaI n=1 Tax=Sporosarcina pasteurii TaxID=1474 RepID=A0A380C495_SPOPA|nr:Primosomal protein DnaI [Sporosarcina pasteurii]
MNAPSFATRYDEMRREILENANVQKFLSDHADELNKDIVDRSLGKLYEYTTASIGCDKCNSLTECTNIMKGFEPKLVLKSNLIDIEYVKCQLKLIDEDRRNISKMIESMYMPKDVMEAKLEDIDFEGNAHKSRLTVIEKAEKFLYELDETGKLPRRGLYIHGPFGIGKSFILGALANELAQRRIRTVAVYVPEFLREIKQSIQDQTLNEKVDYVKKAPVLILDDFGAEAMTSWTRDEILGAILQYRMAEQLPTFFTSNLSFKELEHHLTYTQRGEKDVVKAARIMERIQTVARPVELSGENRRLK